MRRSNQGQGHKNQEAHPGNRLQTPRPPDQGFHLFNFSFAFSLLPPTSQSTPKNQLFSFDTAIPNGILSLLMTELSSHWMQGCCTDAL